MWAVARIGTLLRESRIHILAGVTVLKEAGSGNPEPLWALLSPIQIGYITHFRRESAG